MTPASIALRAPLDDPETEALVSPEAALVAMLLFETGLAQAEADHGVVPPAAGAAIEAALREFQPDIASLRQGIERDGMVVPELVRQIRLLVGAQHAPYVHFGATSQDVIDTALVLQTSRCLDLFERRLGLLVAALETLKERFGDRQLMGYTRMQPAIAISVADRVDSWIGPLERHLSVLPGLRRMVLSVQFGGAAGTLEKLGDASEAVRASLARRLELHDAPQWHSQRYRIAELAGWLSQVTGGLGKLGQDVALMARDGQEIALDGGGASSAMPHKNNPVDAELLVALARFNAVQISGIHQALVHEQERSGAAWALEWMILPQMLVATGASTRIAGRLFSKVTRVGS